MTKVYSGALFVCSVLSISAQEVVWQKDIKSSTQDFLSQVTTTIDQQYLITGSSIQTGNSMSKAGGKSHLPRANSQQPNIEVHYLQNHQ